MNKAARETEMACLLKQYTRHFVFLIRSLKGRTLCSSEADEVIAGIPLCGAISCCPRCTYVIINSQVCASDAGIFPRSDTLLIVDHRG